MEFSRPEYCSGLPFPSPGDLPNSGIEPRSPTLQADALPADTCDVSGSLTFLITQFLWIKGSCKAAVGESAGLWSHLEAAGEGKDHF